MYEDGDVGPEGGRNMYVHHDIMLSAFPLALAWLDCGPADREKGKYSISQILFLHVGNVNVYCFAVLINEIQGLAMICNQVKCSYVRYS